MSYDEKPVAALMAAFRSDPRLVAVVEAFATEGSAQVGRHGLLVNGQLFARFTQGTLVVKLPEARVAALVAARVGTRCDPVRGRLRKWLKITSTKVSWIALAKEAYAFVKGGTRSGNGAARRLPSQRVARPQGRASKMRFMGV